jgi:hypothetical protein
MYERKKCVGGRDKMQIVDIPYRPAVTNYPEKGRSEDPKRLPQDP